MAIDLDEQDGQTPLDPGERAGLIPEYLAALRAADQGDYQLLLAFVRS
jgi:hypothetical protein